MTQKSRKTDKRMSFLTEKLQDQDKIRLLAEKLQDKEFQVKLEKNAQKALAELGLEVVKGFPQSLKFDLSLPLEIQFPWHLVAVKWYPWWWYWRIPWWPWWPRYHKPELPLYYSECCCHCCHC